jgi:hypothetical protein
MDRLDDLARDDPYQYPRAELERWFFAGGVNGSARIRGNVLNQVLHVTTYEAKAWFILTEDGIARWE